YLRAGAHQDDVGQVVGVDAELGEHVGAPVDVLVAGGAVQNRHVLPAQNQGGGPVVVDGGPPGHGGLVGICGPDDPESGHGPEAGQVLDGLVGGTVLSHTHRVVGPGVDDLVSREGGETDRGTHVIAEHEERAAHGDDAAMARQAVEDSAHGVFA